MKSKKNKQIVLDIDLDYFYTPIFYGDPNVNREDYSDFNEKVKLQGEFQDITQKFSITPETYSGKILHHQELFYLWERAIDLGILTPPFAVYHIDAHCDIYTENIRVNADLNNLQNLACSNFLVFAIHRGFINHLVWGVPEDGDIDYFVKELAFVYKGIKKLKNNQFALSVNNNTCLIEIEKLSNMQKLTLPVSLITLCISPGFTPLGEYEILNEFEKTVNPSRMKWDYSKSIKDDYLFKKLDSIETRLAQIENKL